eukprot:31354-Pelagococcus_subviridis.AAC.22
METTGRSIPEIFRSRQVAFQRAQREKNAKNKGGFKRDGGRGWGRESDSFLVFSVLSRAGASPAPPATPPRFVFR